MKLLEFCITVIIMAGIGLIALSPALLIPKPHKPSFVERFEPTKDGERPAIKGDLEAAGLATYHRNH